MKKNHGKMRNFLNAGGNASDFSMQVTAAVLRSIRTEIKKINPPTQRELANKFGLSLGTINRAINNVIGAKLRKKGLVHKLDRKTT